MKRRAFAALVLASALWPAARTVPLDAERPAPVLTPVPLDAALDRLEGALIDLRDTDAGFAWSAGLLRRDGPVVEAGGIRMAPLGGFGAAELRRGLVCYRSEDGRSAIAYRPTARGVKEDLVILDAAAFGTGVFGWTLDLDGLEARLEDDGSIGIYGGDGANVSVSDSASAALVAKMREREEKTRLRARLPAPVSVDAHGRPLRSHYRLAGAALAVVVESTVAFPVTVDPTIVLTTDSDFRQGGTDEGLVEFTGNSVHRDLVGGWRVPAFTSAGPMPAAGLNLHASVVVDGRIYAIGGSPGDVPTVRYALINGDGTIGAWSTTTPLPSGRVCHTAVAYGGYIYVLGGGTSGNFADFVGTAFIGKVNTDGTITSWQTGPSIPGGRGYHGAAAHDGRLYVMCGQKPDGSIANDGYTAAIRGDGTITTWTSVAGPGFRQWGGGTAGCFAAEGYLFTVGGNNGTFNIPDVNAARINPDGTLSPWSQMSSMANARSNHGLAVSGGYIFAIGGGAGGSVEAAAINTGRIGPWMAAGSLPSNYSTGTAFAYAGRVYHIGGSDGVSSPLNTLVSTPVAGHTGGWVATNPLPSPRAFHRSVAYNNFLYVAGGQNGPSLNDVWYAPINADGTVGTWSSTASFATARFNFSCTAYNGYFYVIGGYPTGSAPTASVQIAPINANGSLGAFVAGAPLPAARGNMPAVAYNGRMYLIGGTTSGAGDSNQCQFATINPDGTLGTWTMTATLNFTHSYNGVAVWGNRVYCVAGNQEGVGGFDKVEMSTINVTTGTLSAWTTVNSLPVATNATTAEAHDGYLYCIGGAAPGTTDKVWFAQIKTDGTLGPWTQSANLIPNGRQALATAVHNGFFYITGGSDNTPAFVPVVLHARVNAHGSVGVWITTTNFTSGIRGYHASAAYRGFLYVVGGYEGGAVKNDSRYAAINADGSVSAWLAGPNLNIGRFQFKLEAHNGFLYAIGGATTVGGNTATGTVEYAAINGDGTLGPWQFTSPYSAVGVARDGHMTAIWNNRLYVLAGVQPTVGSLSDAFFAPINPDGTLGSWTTVINTPVVMSRAGCLAYNGFLYLMGGETPGIIADCYRTAINGDGTLAGWQKTGYLPRAQVGHYAAAHEGFVYVLGGVSANPNVHLTSTLFAPILSNGELGPWQFAPTFTGGRINFDGALFNGIAYVFGGETAGGTYLGDTQFARLRTPSTRAIYSRLVDLGSDQTVASVMANGGGSNGRASVNIRRATAGGLDFTLAASGAVTFGTPVTVNQTARYLLIRYTLDDSGCVTRNPDDTTHLAIDDITITTTSPPAVPTGANQFQSDGITTIPVGAGATSTTIVINSLVTDPDGDQVRLHVEIQPVGVAFINSPTHSSGFVLSGATATITATGLTPGTAYHWQAVTEDITGSFSQGGAFLFGANAENPPTNPAATDFFIDQAPTAPTMAQFESDGVTPLPNGNTAATSTVVLTGMRNDPDTSLSLVKIQLEFRDNATAFTSPANPIIDGSTFFEAPFLTPGTTASFTIPSLTPGSYKWQMRGIDDTGLASAWTPFNAIQPNFTIASPNSAPNAPAALAQFQSDGTTSLATGGTATSATVVVQGTLSDPDGGDTVKIQVELRDVTTAFTSPAAPVIGGGIFFETSLAAQGIVQLSLGVPADGGYHWQARVVDATGAASAWTPFGGNADSPLPAATDFLLDLVQDAPVPSLVDQYQPDGTTVISVPGSATTTGVVFKARLDDINAGDTIKLQVEVRDIATPLSGTFTHESGFVSTGATASVATGALAIDSYHWAYRAVDSNGNPSVWVSFGGNVENPPTNPADPDFLIVANSGPVVSALAQFLADGVTPLPTGTTTSSATLVLQATVTDPEAQAVTLEVEVQPVGTPFTGTPTATAAASSPSGSTVQITVTVPGEGAYHWQARATDVGGAAGTFTSYDTNPEVDPDFRVELTNDAPAAPTSLGQYVPPGTTGLALGGSPLGRTVVVRAMATDPEGRQLTLQVEVQPVGTAFTDTPTHSSTSTPSGVFGSVELSNLPDGPFHWQARSLDDIGQASSWVAYGSNPETSPDFTITATTAVPPNAPISMEQRTSNGLATVTTGATVAQAALLFRALVVHPRTEIVKLQVEVKPTALAFTGTPDRESDFVNSGTVTEVLVFGFPNADFHWQARTIDSKGTSSAWIVYGGNAEGDADFVINVPANTSPYPPALSLQYRADGITPLSTGATTAQSVVSFVGFASDADGDSVRLEIEVKPVGIAFDGGVSGTSGFYSNGSNIVQWVAALADGRYHWRARVTDSNGASSAWVAYGGNPETDADFIVNVLTNTAPAAATVLDQLRDGSISIGVGQPAGPSAITLRGDATDAEADLVRLEVEVRSAGSALASVPTHSGVFGPSGFNADAVVDRFVIGDTQHWQARVVDSNGLASGWVEFGGAGADFVPSVNVAGQSSKTKVCGALGLELVLVMVLLRLARRRR